MIYIVRLVQKSGKENLKSILKQHFNEKIHDCTVEYSEYFAITRQTFTNVYVVQGTILSVQRGQDIKFEFRFYSTD